MLHDTFANLVDSQILCEIVFFIPPHIAAFETTHNLCGG